MTESRPESRKDGQEGGRARDRNKHLGLQNKTRRVRAVGSVARTQGWGHSACVGYTGLHLGLWDPVVE